jgi:hypothetical protein
MPPPGGTQTALSQMVAWLTSKAKANPTQGTKTNADEKPFDVNQFKETFQPDDGVFSPKSWKACLPHASVIAIGQRFRLLRSRKAA